MALLCVGFLACGCATSDSMRNDPVRSVWGAPAQPAGPTQIVFFATDRGPPVWKNDYAFGPHWSGELHCGKVKLDIPPATSFDEKAPATSPKARSDIACATAASPANFAVQVTKAATGCGHVLVVVHGYNTSFRTAIFRAGQVAHDMAWPCPVLLFSWSSEGQADRYAADIEHSAYAAPLLTRLLKQLNGSNNDHPSLFVDVLAHSMGNRLTLSALAPLCQAQNRPRVRELIMAAADVGAENENDDFNRLLSQSAPCLSRATIYASDNDLALLTSESVHGGVPRAGRQPHADMSYVTAGGKVEVVDATLAPAGSAGHSYFSLSYEMVKDMRWVLNGVALKDRIGKPGNDGLSCLAWDGKTCPDGRYVLNVAPSRQPTWGFRFFRQLWPH